MVVVLTFVLDRNAILDGEDQRDLIKLAMEDASLVGTGRYAPKPASVQHLISFAFNTRRPLAELVAERYPEWFQLTARESSLTFAILCLVSLGRDRIAHAATSPQTIRCRVKAITLLKEEMENPVVDHSILAGTVALLAYTEVR